MIDIKTPDMKTGDIKAGFTGRLDDRTGAAATVKRVADTVQYEAGRVVATAQDHRTATGTVLLLVGAAAFAAGYFLGAGEREARGFRFRR